MAKNIECITADFDAALLRFMSTSKKAAAQVMNDQARLLFVEVAKVTPPNGGASGATLTGVEAEKAGRLAIVRDYHQIYGMPGRAYSDLQDAAGPSVADSFWACLKSERYTAAESIVKNNLGKSFVPFDGGKAARGFLGKKKQRKPLFYISNPDALQAHVAELQKHVWFLASGWRDALTALHAKIPYGVNKQSGPGSLSVVITDQKIEIVMSNDVRFAGNVKDLRNRVAFAMQVRTGVLQRRWDEYIKLLGPKDGFKVS